MSYIRLVGLMHDSHLCKISLLLRFLLGQNVALESMLVLETVTGRLEALCGASFGLHLYFSHVQFLRIER